jgi:hypothetical protein
MCPPRWRLLGLWGEMAMSELGLGGSADFGGGFLDGLADVLRARV